MTIGQLNKLFLTQLEMKHNKKGRIMNQDKPTDICFKCEKVDDLNTMKYVNQDSKYDDRLICNDCQKKERKINE